MTPLPVQPRPAYPAGPAVQLSGKADSHHGSCPLLGLLLGIKNPPPVWGRGKTRLLILLCGLPRAFSVRRENVETNHALVAFTVMRDDVAGCVPRFIACGVGLTPPHALNLPRVTKHHKLRLVDADKL